MPWIWMGEVFKLLILAFWIGLFRTFDEAALRSPVITEGLN